MGKNLYLIGLPGSGKSQIGKMVAKKLGYAFRDTDKLIEKKTGESVTDIFDARGEEAFRLLEQDILVELATERNRVIATGGGIVENPENVKIMQQSGKVIWIRRDVEDILGNPRIQNRPLLKDHPEKLFALAQKRNPLYRSAADNWVYNRENRLGVVDEIIRIYRLQTR